MLEASAVSCLGYMEGSKEIQGIHCPVVLQVLRSLGGLLSSLHLSTFLCLFVVLCPGFFSCKERTWEQWDYSILAR